MSTDYPRSKLLAFIDKWSFRKYDGTNKERARRRAEAKLRAMDDLAAPVAALLADGQWRTLDGISMVANPAMPAKDALRWIGGVEAGEAASNPEHAPLVAYRRPVRVCAGIDHDEPPMAFE